MVKASNAGQGNDAATADRFDRARSRRTVTTCFGTCPMGECDDNMFFSKTPCSSVYTGPIDASSMHCAAGANGAYRLNISGGPRYGVTCSAGVASVTPCANGCGIVGK